MRHHLDHAATTPLRPEAREVLLALLDEGLGNPSSTHALGVRAAEVLDSARAQVAAVTGARRGDVVFTSGGTESNNLAVKGLVLGARAHTGAARLVTTPIEHSSVRESAAALARLHGVEVTELPVDRHGLVDPADLRAALRPGTALVSIALANNEVGTVQDIPALAAVAHEHGVPVHVDAVQAAGWLPISLPALGADAVSLAGHKIGAGPGTGALVVRGRLPLEPLLHGGGQERGRRSGTPDVPGAAAFATALALVERDRPEAAARVAPLRDAFVSRVLARVAGSALTGHPRRRLAGSASFVFDGANGETVLLELERRGVLSSSGSACSAGSEEASPVLLALGLTEDLARTAVRFSLPHGLREPLDEVADALAEAVSTLTRR